MVDNNIEPNLCLRPEGLNILTIADNQPFVMSGSECACFAQIIAPSILLIMMCIWDSSSSQNFKLRFEPKTPPRRRARATFKIFITQNKSIWEKGIYRVATYLGRKEYILVYEIANQTFSQACDKIYISIWKLSIVRRGNQNITIIYREGGVIGM